MKQSSVVVNKKAKRIGRPPRPEGVDPVAAVRLPPKLLAHVDAWQAEKGFKKRSDAIRDMITFAVAAKAIDGMRAKRKK